MWDDDHISRHLLTMHLDGENDVASRNKATIRNTVAWIESQFNGSQNNILDLGCGPGLYCELLAEHGNNVVGVDYSKRSIAYAKEQAAQKHLHIEYLCENYLDLSFRNRFNLVIMIYCNFCVLIPRDRDRLLQMISRALKPGGLFIFDALNENAPGVMEIPGKSFEIAESGFWKDEPYLALCRITRKDCSFPVFQELYVRLSTHTAQVFHYPLLWAQNKKIRIDFCVERKIPFLLLK